MCKSLLTVNLSRSLSSKNHSLFVIHPEKADAPIQAARCAVCFSTTIAALQADSDTACHSHFNYKFSCIAMKSHLIWATVLVKATHGSLQIGNKIALISVELTFNKCLQKVFLKSNATL